MEVKQTPGGYGDATALGDMERLAVEEMAHLALEQKFEVISLIKHMNQAENSSAAPGGKVG